MPTLLVLAAGLGSRYGGLKQLDPVGPGGATLLDYAVFDARRAGFGRVVFVVRRDFEADFRAQVAARYEGRIEVELAFQELGDLPPGFAPPPGRTRPWGTAQAVWSARRLLTEEFAAVNADDFYGAAAYRRLIAGFGASGPVPRFSLVGYRLADTLSEHGAVSRGLCAVDERGLLRSIEETSGLAPAGVGPGRPYTGEEIVSMNCWGFGPALLPLLEEEWRSFLAARGSDLRAECYLPAAVSALVARGAAEVRVLPTAGPWFGLTHPGDRDRVAAALAALVRRGDYPERLF
jgi:NDP-sugar pyrophosphorylase family protein